MKVSHFWHTFGISAIEVVLVILLLLGVRDFTKAAIVDLQQAAPDLARLQDELVTQNLTTYDYGKASAQIGDVSKVVSQGMFVAEVVLPIGLFIVIGACSFLIWSRLAQVRLVYFLKYFTVLFLIAYLFVSNFFSFLSYFLVGDGDFSLSFFGITGIFLLVWSYIYVVSLVHKKSFIQNGKFVWKHMRSLAGWFVLFVVFSKLIAVLVMLIFIFLWAGTSILIPSILLVLCILAITWTRQRFVQKITGI